MAKLVSTVMQAESKTITFTANYSTNRHTHKSPVGMQLLAERYGIPVISQNSVELYQLKKTKAKVAGLIYTSAGSWGKRNAKLTMRFANPPATDTQDLFPGLNPFLLCRETVCSLLLRSEAVSI